jgi:hypothetical protein
MVASSPGLDHRTTGGELPEEHLSSSEHERRESPERKVTHSGTWRFRSFLLQVGIFMPVLGIAVGVGGVNGRVVRPGRNSLLDPPGRTCASTAQTALDGFR